MHAGILGDLKRFATDVLVGICIFGLTAIFVLDGQIPASLPKVATVLSIDANAAEHAYSGYGPQILPKSAIAADSNAFRFTGGWTAIILMASMFSLLYAFNLALFRRYYARQQQVNRRRFPPR
jgi:hypothetical protein